MAVLKQQNVGKAWHMSRIRLYVVVKTARTWESRLAYGYTGVNMFIEPMTN